MLKVISSFLCVCLVGFSTLFAAPGPSMGPPPMPPRQDKIDYTSKAAQVKLQRAEKILSSLVAHPENYQLFLSSRTCFGGEAIPAHFLSDKPTMIVYQGSLSPNRSDEEVAFMMAHELGHLNLYHGDRTNEQMEQIFTAPPIAISGTTFVVYSQKFYEQEADMYGLYLYHKSGYNMAFFPHMLRILNFNPNIHFGSSHVFRKELSSLSWKDTHFSMKERFELLVHKAATDYA